MQIETYFFISLVNFAKFVTDIMACMYGNKSHARIIKQSSAEREKKLLLLYMQDIYFIFLYIWMHAYIYGYYVF